VTRSEIQSCKSERKSGYVCRGEKTLPNPEGEAEQELGKEAGEKSTDTYKSKRWTRRNF